MANIEDLTQDDIDKMEKALDRYKKENQKFRTERDELQEQLETSETSVKFKDRAIKAEAKLAFANEGIKDSDRFLKYLDLSKISVDDEDKLVGLDDEVNRIKGDFPELFEAKRRVGGRVDAAANSPATVKKSTTEMQVDSLFKR